MSAPFSQLHSAATISPTPVRVAFPDEQIAELKTLVKLAKIAPPTLENQQQDRRYGVTSDWLTTMREKWLNDYNWRATEARINSFPQFTTQIEDMSLHFAALFSEKKDAIPMILLHGWPGNASCPRLCVCAYRSNIGSFLEFLPILQLFKEEYTPTTLPFHLIVPSLPGYGFSSGPPLDREYKSHDVARVMDQLMKGLGFGGGYIAQGGDIGSRIARVLAVDFESCKGQFEVHPSIVMCTDDAVAAHCEFISSVPV
jgi:microsomal epoxide hydrolase